MKKKLDYVEVLYDEKLKPFTEYPTDFQIIYSIQII